MDVRRLATILFVFFLLNAAPAAQAAYLPYLEEGSGQVAVTRPEISQAHYGWLTGSPAVYAISSKKPFKLYLNLMSPQLSDARVDFSADIYKDGELIYTMNGIDFVWLAYYEPFANDYYIRGPEYETDAGPGDYRIEVYNSANYGDYVLAVGKTEDRSLGEFLRTMSVLPEIKERFFGKNPWDAYHGFAGLDALGILLVLLVLLVMSGFAIRRRRLKNRLDHEDHEYKNNRGSRGENYIDLSEVQRLFGRR
jgi:hypothetical protein